MFSSKAASLFHLKGSYLGHKAGGAGICGIFNQRMNNVLKATNNWIIALQCLTSHKTVPQPVIWNFTRTDFIFSYLPSNHILWLSGNGTASFSVIFDTLKDAYMSLLYFLYLKHKHIKGKAMQGDLMPSQVSYISYIKATFAGYTAKMKFQRLGAPRFFYNMVEIPKNRSRRVKCFNMN